MAASSTKLDVPIVRPRSVLVEIAEIVEGDARSINAIVDQVELVVAIIKGRSTGAEGHTPSYRSEISLRDRHADRGRASSAPGRGRRRATNSERDRMVDVKPLFVSSVSIVTSAPGDDRRLFVDVLGLPLTGDEDYVFTEGLPGVKHFGVWPLAQAAWSCFGTETWPGDRPIPQASIEFDVEDVTAGAEELRAQGYELLHPPRTDRWGQTVARLQSPGGLIVGVSVTPSMRRPRSRAPQASSRRPEADPDSQG